MTTMAINLWQQARLQTAIWISLAAVLFAILVGLVLVASMGVPLTDAISAFAEGAWGSPYAIAASVNRALALGLVGVGFVLANRANLTNVGGEGQIALGGIAATAMSLYGGASHLPGPLPFIVPMIAAALAGGAWGGIAGVLKAKVGTNEVISTLLMSFIAVWLVYWCVQSESLLRQPMHNTATLPESLEIPEVTKIPLLTGDYSMPLHWGLPIALVLAVIVAIVLDKTVFGLRLRAVGLNPVAARRAGIAIVPSILLVLFLAGALGGLAGAFMLQGDQYSLKARFSSGYGFDGLVVGLLARGSVPGVIASALLFGFLRSGGINMELAAGIPSAIVMVIQGVIIVTLAGAAFWMERKRSGK
ncbi:MAG: transporter permease [Rhodocyclales bacterium]|nr:transporter permease [Rhodocyclales bacterium]